MSKSKYFQTTKRGEVKDWKDDLNSLDKDKVKEAVKKVIAAMTVGKDVSMLFPDIIKSMPTENLELKKLVYLYIINYARSQPDKAILVINTFHKDASISTQKNPLIRALAIRTMGCIRVDRITEHLCEPLGRALDDEDPYVRKTAAVCVAKLFDINPELAEERGFVEKLRELLTDSSPMVVANAVAALAEISETGQSDVFKITPTTLQGLLTALNECTEWGQVFILDALARYEPNEEEAFNITDRVTPRLKHSNSALVLSAIKVIVKYLDIIEDRSMQRQLEKKLAPPLVTLLSAEPEIQYVALRNIDLIVQKRPDVLSREFRVFFCKYNDPIYVKMEKIEIMIKLASDSNIDQMLLEFKEYAQAVDVDFVRKSVKAIGRCAIKLGNASERCVRVLLELIETKVSYVLQEAVIVIKDIFRRYPNRYEGVIVNLCENLDSLDEPEAKAAMIWIIGEYAERIEDAGDRLEAWIETFEDESAEVQLQLLTATVKLFLKRPDVAKDMVGQVLKLCTDNVDNPDLRDRGYIYWRLLANDPAAAKDVVLAEKPVISDETFLLDSNLLDILIANVATLASVYHKPPENFVKGIKTMVFHAAEDIDEEEEEEEEEIEEEEEEEDEEETAEKYASPEPIADLDDLLGFGSGMGSAPAVVSFPETKTFKVLNADKGKGLEILSSMTRTNGQAQLVLHFTNRSSQAIPKMAIQFNKNFLGISPSQVGIDLPSPVTPGSNVIARVPIVLSGPPSGESKPGVLQVALKTALGVLYFAAPISAHIFFQENGKMEKKDFLQTWQSIEEEQCSQISPLPMSPDALISRLEAINVFTVASVRNVPSKGDCTYSSARINQVPLLIEFAIGSDLGISVKSSDAYLANVVSKSLKFFLTS